MDERDCVCEEEVKPVAQKTENEETKLDEARLGPVPNNYHEVVTGISDANQENEASDSEDFGNFSDASFEPEQEEITPEDDLANVEKYLDQILPFDENIPKVPLCSKEPEALITEERPRIIYEQLVLLRTVLKPFIWNKSHIKSNLWHILRIPEKVKPIEQNIGREPLDDRLFIVLCNMLHGNKISSRALLRDQLGIIYSPQLAPIFLRKEFENQKEGEIPHLLSISPDEVENLQVYHDKLCQAIDLLLLKLQESHTEQTELVKDKITFENVVTNLTGHTQRLYRDEVALYNKHKGRKKSRFSWVGR